MGEKRRSKGSSSDAALLAFRTAAAQAQHEALLARAERRRWRQLGVGRLATLLAFPLPPSLRPLSGPGPDIGPRPERCQWLYGDGPFADADKCGAPTMAGQSYCRAHLPRLFLVPEDAPNAAEAPGRAGR